MAADKIFRLMNCSDGETFKTFGVNFTKIFAQLFGENKLSSFFGHLTNGQQIWQTVH